ncbi:MAG: 2-succinyl-5-enolpyruvyl-6-hydroxy-3-cyclohexene-1-carboxylic-acid synthase [Armatimonadota bacterium]|nr:2-succinyl-5-enolpyruvyl-6-hydroxy-3-cyclohexene-1-carboxylic-acid synthase [Armatimonadota bacterium]MDW8156067.1 2-succinyl-5-enolpyruvyl-6-hydroxy-3-cyclohexene-1-carboxylic-acid synthase [Armatimonadota bacterium]
MREPENATYSFCSALVDELWRGGVRDVCLCPGSRSAPLALSAWRHPGLRTWTLLDERGMGFFATGLARASRRPVAALTTSGTAAANLLPAVVEAYFAGVPLVVVTADRPHEVRGFGALQTVGQVRLFEGHVKFSADLPLPEADDRGLRFVRSLTCRALQEACSSPQGPAHLNVPLREPLVPVPGPLPAASSDAARGRPGGGPYTAWSTEPWAAREHDVAELAEWLGRCERGVIVCGPLDRPGFPDAVAELAGLVSYPVLAEPLSQVRAGPHDRSQVVDCGEALLRVPGLAETLTPEVVLRFGATPTSRTLQAYLSAHPRAHHVVVHEGGAWPDPDHVAGRVVHADPVQVCRALAQRLQPRARGAWWRTWSRLQGAAREALRHFLQGVSEPFEGRVFWELAALLPDPSVLFVGNSMPVRDLDAFFPCTEKRVRMLANRGASGIDGVVSSALGVAAAAGQPVVLVVGDVSFYHDLNGLLAARRFGLDLVVVLLHNDGGGVFSFLPQAEHGEGFEELFGTPHGLDFRPAVEMFGGRYQRVRGWEDFREAVRDGLGAGGLQVVEVRTDRRRNAELHRAAWAAVTHAVGQA